MRKQVFELDGRAVTLYTDDAPQILFIQPVDEHDTELLDAEIEAMRDCALPFALAAFEVRDWNRELSPWEAPPVFGKVPFGGMAEETLSFVLDRLLPELRTRLGADMKLCIGGYSLAGLFALWAATRTDAFFRCRGGFALGVVSGLDGLCESKSDSGKGCVPEPRRPGRTGEESRHGHGRRLHP